MLDTGSGSRNIPYAATAKAGTFLYGMAGSGISVAGIVVGLLNTPPTINDVALGTQIAHGTGLNQLLHNAQTQEAVVISAPTASFRVTRTFTNNSAAPITVYEIGWYWQVFDTGGTQRYFCFLHDLLASPQTIPIGATLTVRYTWSVTV
jgi:hypothetical protein